MAVIKPINKSSIKMRIHFLVLATGLAGLQLVAPSQSKAQDPLENQTSIKTCAELQRYHNGNSWNTPTSFQGFENVEPRILAGIMCTGGYIIEETPMGRKVCIGAIALRNNGEADWSGGTCRWQ